MTTKLSSHVSLDSANPNRPISTYGQLSAATWYFFKQLEVTGELRQKSPGHNVPGFLSVFVLYSTKEDIMTSGTICQNRRIYNLTTGATLPCIERTDKIIIFLCVHTAFTFWTSHVNLSLSSYSKNITQLSKCTMRYYTRHANS
jgi:hypothetical protein